MILKTNRKIPLKTRKCLTVSNVMFLLNCLINVEYILLHFIFVQVVETNESADMHVERVYCGHLFHLLCLITYMKIPPFKGMSYLFDNYF